MKEPFNIMMLINLIDKRIAPICSRSRQTLANGRRDRPNSGEFGYENATPIKRANFFVSALSIAPIVLFLTGNSAHAADRVAIHGSTGIGEIILTGNVLDWTGEQLNIRVGKEAIRKIDADRVKSVDTVRLADHVAGITALAEGRIDEAEARLKQALDAEPRTWMRREILAQLVRTDLARGDRLAAGTHFLALFESDPHTFWFNRIPLDWRVEPPEARNLDTARNWMRPGESDAAGLVGASILLLHPTAEARAVERLEQLAVSGDHRIFPLARAQLWRLELREESTSRLEVERWTDRLDEIPETLRGGPRYLIGHGYASIGNPERAATNWLWLPLVYDQDPRLAAEAEILAAEQLTKIGKPLDAIVLYREVIERFEYTPSHEIAKQALKTMADH